MPLKYVYHLLYEKVSSPNVSVAELAEVRGDKVNWNISFPYDRIPNYLYQPFIKLLEDLNLVDKILMVDNLIKRRKIITNICLMCKADGETGTHLSIHCSFVSKIWWWCFHMMGINLMLPLHVVDLIVQMDVPLPKLGGHIWKVLRGAILWEVWLERNRRTFEGKVNNFEKVISNINWMCLEIDIVLDRSHLIRRVLKFNFDGSTLGNPGSTGFGGVIHDWQGNMLLAYAGPCGSTTANNAELLGLVHGLKILLARLSGYGFIIEGDSMNVINWCKKEQCFPWQLKFIGLQIFDLIVGLSLSFEHMYREANSVVDSLAKRGVLLDSVVVADSVVSLM
ncbi:uncharacterized protein LOC110007976 [Amborella trichopoda]|uniref:uncharacterized protein LOC110007976 n=1 Tax=Amborella trichopoda TaxID=13333 RepID=UPI0009BFD92E|nr:uncharacterized protein LOC110007976 [Amborella trichopoda]|eukprot:XP_020528247.1 uncharacterized protein LOC110007976 [Amborella trichopoda]